MIETPALANDKYRALLRSTWIYDPADTDIQVDAIPANLPTIITVGWETQYETVFRVTGASGENSSNYALTGVTRIKGFEGNLPEGLTVNCLNNEEYFNQWGDQIAAVQEIAEEAQGVAEKVDSTWVDLTDGATIDLDLGNGANRKFRVTIAGNRTLTFSNPLLGQVFTLRATQDENGNRALTFPSGITWAGGEVPDQPKVANTTDSYIFICTNTETPAYDGYVLGNEMAVPA